MKLIQNGRESATYQISYAELCVLNNALNEVCHALGLDEFSTRMGVELHEAQQLLSQVNGFLRTMETDRAKGV